MGYLALLILSVITPLFAYYFSDALSYRFHYRDMVRSDKWFWQRDLSDEELDVIAHQHAKKFAKISAWVVSVICISVFIYVSFLSFSEMI